jgi:hypothetical protein
MTHPNLWATPDVNMRPDGLLNAVPVVICRNEERFIRQVLRPLYAVFGYAIVGDNGSTDSTIDILYELAREGHIYLVDYGTLDMVYVGRARADLGQRAAEELGARYMWLCDGDELYNEAALRYAVQQTLPEGKTFGMVAGCNVEEHAGQFYELAEPYRMTGRTALIRNDDNWRGEYPFESPGDFDRPERHHWFTAPPGFDYTHLHLHRCRRSTRDSEVPYRTAKRQQFSMRDAENVQRSKLIDMAAWTAPEEVVEWTKTKF